MRTIVGEQNTAHFVAALFFFFFFDFLSAAAGVDVSSGLGAAALASGALSVVVAAGAAPAGAGGFARASGLLSSVLESFTVWTLTSAVTPAPPAGATGTLAGVEGRSPSMAGVPDFAAILTSGLLLNMLSPFERTLAFFRFSSSYFWRA